jgi:FMN phosphatase YigB (HAD superfamily)
LIQAITFDFWNTLFVGTFATDLRRRRIKRALAQAGHAHISETRIQEAIGRTWREWDRVWVEEQRTFGAPRWVALVLADLGVNLPHPEQEALVQATIASGLEVKPPLIDGVADVLPRLAQRYKLGLVCDTGLSPGWILRQWMDTHGILGHFDHLTFSNELGLSKPHPRAFLSTLEALNVPPPAAVHVGDNPRTDVEGAQGVGMRAIRFLGPYQWPDSAIQADAEFADYGRLETLLEQMEGQVCE